MTGYAQTFREEITRACTFATGKAALLLSGGLDSGSIFGGCLNADIPFDVVTATYGEFDTPDSRSAQGRHHFLARNRTFKVIRVRRDPQDAERCARWFIDRCGAVYKAQIEVCVFMLPVIEELLRSGYTTLINGMSGGVLWGVNKEPLILRSKQGDEAWNKERAEMIRWEYAGVVPGASRLFRHYLAERNARWYDPLAALTPLLLRCSFSQMNKPYPKALVARAFPELTRVPYNQGGLQVVGGVREYMEIVAKEKGYKSPVLWYNAIAKSMGIPPRGSTERKKQWSFSDEREDQMIARLTAHQAGDLQLGGKS